MSAWIVSKTHIDALVHAGIDAELIRPEEADEFGRMLWRENLHSIEYRYPGDRDGQRPGPSDFRDADVEAYTFQFLDGGPSASRNAPAVVCQTAGCYDYQTCEHPEYEGSKAQKFAGMLTTLTEHARPAPDSDVPWGTDTRDAFVVGAS